MIKKVAIWIACALMFIALGFILGIVAADGDSPTPDGTKSR